MRLPGFLRGPFFRTAAGAFAIVATSLAVPAPTPEPEPALPAWTRGAVVYGVVPPLFGKPPLRAVTARLDELEALGIDALWISPVNESSDPGDFGYEVTDHLGVREEFGTEADLRALVDEAHRRGMRVLLDIVPNHVSEEHAIWKDVAARGEASRWHGWFDHGTPHYFEWDHLENLDVNNPEVEAAITSWFLHWVREFDVDGFRVDVAWGIRERNPELWPRLIRTLRAEKPELFLLAEASAHDPYYVAAGFDAAYDWTEQLGHWAWDEAWSNPDRAGTKLGEALQAGETPPGRVARFLNNNDTGERFITRHGAALTRAAATMLLTLPGLPIVYSGDEIGAAYEPYHEPPPLDWNADAHDLERHYARLIELREALPGLASAEWTWLPTDDPSVLAYVRHGRDGADPVLVAVNFGGPTEVRLERRGIDPRSELLDVLTCRPFPAPASETHRRLALDARAAIVLAAPSSAARVCPTEHARRAD